MGNEPDLPATTAAAFATELLPTEQKTGDPIADAQRLDLAAKVAAAAAPIVETTPKGKQKQPARADE